jgi:hypothetical protein
MARVVGASDNSRPGCIKRGRTRRCSRPLRARDRSHFGSFGGALAAAERQSVGPLNPSHSCSELASITFRHIHYLTATCCGRYMGRIPAPHLRRGISTMRLRRKLLISGILLFVLPALFCIGWFIWYSIEPAFPVPPNAMNHHSEPRFGGPDHDDAWISFDIPAPPEAVIAFYRHHWASCTEEGYCSGVTFLGRAEYRIREIRGISDRLTHVEAYMHWSSF